MSFVEEDLWMEVFKILAASPSTTSELCAQWATEAVRNLREAHIELAAEAP